MKKWKMLVLLLSCWMVCAAATAETFTPGTAKCGKAYCYWETPMDISNVEALWSMLIQPMTTVKGDPREQVVIRSAPSSASPAIGEVTCYSQGVHVLEHMDNGWSRIECYSSSFKGSKTEAWNKLLTGYIETNLLQQFEVKTKYGLIVDKLTQRLYVFQDGALLDELAVSTGLPNADQPYNETRSGEYLLFSRTGAFPSDNLTCNYGMRFNAGDLLHEVPHTVGRDGTRNYSRTESKLGSRASHGCIRVQRKRTVSGMNMRWIWEALSDQMGTRIVIWEDSIGRQMGYPSSDLCVYYNPNKGQYYHKAEKCYGVKDKYLPLQPLTYGELENDAYAELLACPYCNPPLRLQQIDEINRAHQSV